MRNIIYIIAVLLILLIIRGIIEYLRYPKEQEEGKVYLPKFLGALGIVIVTVFLTIALILTFSDETFMTQILMLGIAFSGAIFIIGFINCKIYYDEYGFTSKNFFGIERSFTYDRIEAIKENMFEKYIYVEKSRVMVDEMSVGGREFIKFVKAKYKQLHKGRGIPKIYKTKHDIFNGNIKSPGEFIFVYSMITVFMIVPLVCAVMATYYAPSNISNTIEQSLKFASCEVRKNEIVLISEDDQLYKIKTDKHINTTNIQALCNGEKAVTVYYHEASRRYDSKYNSIRAVADNGHFILSFEETNRLQTQNNSKGLVVLLVFFLIWIAFIVLSVIVGRNPQKFSKSFVRLFFKDGYVRYR